MAPGIGAGGYVGIALEAASGTYTAPTKFIPINNESLQYMGEPSFRRPIKQTADNVWAVPGNAHVEGPVEMDALDDVMPYFMYASRMTVVKGGLTPNFTYTGTPNANAIPQKTLSITVERNGIIFGYTGCVVSSFVLALNEGTLTYNVQILGTDEGTEAAPGSVTWGTSTPYGAGMYDIQIPTGVQVFDTDTFEWSVEDNAEAQFRAKNTSRGAQFVKFGERNVGLTIGRDFESKTDYDAFKAVTAHSVTLAAEKGANNSISVVIPANIKNTYELGLSGQGDLLRGQINYTALDSATGSYQLVVATQEDIVIV